MMPHWNHNKGNGERNTFRRPSSALHLVLDFFPEGGTKKIVFMMIARYVDEDGLGWVYNDSLVRAAAVDERNVRRAVTWLEDEGWIKRDVKGAHRPKVRTDSRPNRYVIDLDRLHALEAEHLAKIDKKRGDGSAPTSENRGGDSAPTRGDDSAPSRGGDSAPQSKRGSRRGRGKFPPQPPQAGDDPRFRPGYIDPRLLD